MSRPRRARASLGLLVLFLAGTACGGKSNPGVPTDGGAGGGGGGAGAAASCLERPGDLPRPPGGPLPCELIPPGLQLPR